MHTHTHAYIHTYTLTIQSRPKLLIVDPLDYEGELISRRKDLEKEQFLNLLLFPQQDVSVSLKPSQRHDIFRHSLPVHIQAEECGSRLPSSILILARACKNYCEGGGRRWGEDLVLEQIVVVCILSLAKPAGRYLTLTVCSDVCQNSTHNIHSHILGRKMLLLEK